MLWNMTEFLVLAYRHQTKGKFPHFFRKMAKAHSNSLKILADNKNIFVCQEHSVKDW